MNGLKRVTLSSTLGASHFFLFSSLPSHSYLLRTLALRAPTEIIFEGETQEESLVDQLESLSNFFQGATDVVKNHINVTFKFSEDSDIHTEVMFINVAALFALFNLPYSIVECADDWRLDHNPNPKLTSMFLVIFVVGFNLNPFIFYLSNPWYRDEIKRIFCFYRRSEQQLSESETAAIAHQNSPDFSVN